MPEGSTPIARILMEDSAKIMATDAETLSRQYGRSYHPIYEPSDVERCVDLIREYPIGKTVTLNEYVKFRFVPSGHILNSAQIEITVTEGNITKTIGYTSDLGNIHIEKSYTNKFEPMSRVDVLIGETTYGGEDRIATKKVRQKDLEKLKSVIENTCKERGGRVLLPCFANSRTQEMLTHIYDLFGHDDSFNIPVLVDTPMGVRICEAYQKLLTKDEQKKWEAVTSWRNVRFVIDPSESKAWQMDGRPAIIISSSGMMTHGRSRAYAKEMLNDEKNVIVFCGFSVDNSLASIIKQGKVKMIKLGGRKVANRCRTIDLHSFTSHMQKDDLVRYYSSVDCEKIVLVHGEPSSKRELARCLAEAISKNDKTSRVICAHKGYTLSL